MGNIPLRIILANFMFLLIMPIFSTDVAKAANPADWKAGRIIDDALFLNPNDMSVSDIQNFLNSKVPVCDTSGTQPASEYGRPDLTHAQYAASRGWPSPPYVCLRNYYEVPKTAPGNYIPDNSYNHGGGSFPGGVSAAQIIYDAAQKYGISNKALLVKLATESAGPLTTDTWPFQKQYTYAMGAHCPDSGPGGSANCDINYSGFSMQISEAASLLRWYIDSMTQSWWQYKKPYQVNSILWNVEPTGCSAGNVYLETKATAALYTYTPYQPNQAALNNMYGTGDGCSAYGNRNFWRVWVDWFGNTNGGTPFFSYDGKVFIIGANSTYYYVSSPDLLTAYGLGSRFNAINLVPPSFTNGMVFKGNLPWFSRFESGEIYVVDRGFLHHFPSESDYFNYGYSFGQEAVLPSTLKGYYPISTPVTPVLENLDGPEIYFVSNGKRRHISSEAAYYTLGSPTYNTLPKVSLSQQYYSSIQEGVPILVKGSVTKSYDTGQVGYWDGNQLQKVSDSTAKTWGIAVSYSRPSSIINLLQSNSAIVDRFVISPDGKKYLLDNKRRFDVTNNNLSGGQSFSSVSSEFLDGFLESTLQPAFRQQSSNKVYTMKNQVLYHIPTESDLYGLGLSFQKVSVLLNNPDVLYPYTNASLFASGRLVRVTDRPEVYIIDKLLTRRHVPTEAMLFAYGKTFDDVYVTSNKNAFATYASNAEVSRYISDDSQNKWVVDLGCKSLFDSSLLTNYNLSVDNFAVYDKPITDGLPTCKPMTKLLRGANSLSVYVIENGKKRWIVSEAVFVNNGYSWNNVHVVSQYFIDSIPLGANVN